jgi:hypothetical protein
MDLQRLNQQVNDAVNRWIQGLSSYFSGLSRNEIYGWVAFCLGFVLVVVGFFLL